MIITIVFLTVLELAELALILSLTRGLRMLRDTLDVMADCLIDITDTLDALYGEEGYPDEEAGSMMPRKASEALKASEVSNLRDILRGQPGETE